MVDVGSLLVGAAGRRSKYFTRFLWKSSQKTVSWSDVWLVIVKLVADRATLRLQLAGGIGDRVHGDRGSAAWLSPTARNHPSNSRAQIAAWIASSNQ
jgi:hypothetical protein